MYHIQHISGEYIEYDSYYYNFIYLRRSLYEVLGQATRKVRKQGPIPYADLGLM